MAGGLSMMYEQSNSTFFTLFELLRKARLQYEVVLPLA